MSANTGSAAANPGTSDAKAASVCSKRRHDLGRCRNHGGDGMNRWAGFGVIGDNLMNIATFATAWATG
jgi:hypothetical protein